MRIIEHRRHTMRTKPGEHLSRDGVELARSVGHSLGPFDLVTTSATPRAFETAIAMGFAVDGQVEELALLPEGFEEEVAWDDGYAAFWEAIRTLPEGAVASYARQMRALHEEIVDRLEEGGSALIVSHGGVVEASAIGCLPETDFTAWGPACDYCEGFRIYADSTTFRSGLPLRVDHAAKSKDNGLNAT